MKNGDMPACPVELTYSGSEHIYGLQTGAQSGWAVGLTKRELFAAMAMQGHLANAESMAAIDEIAKRLKQPPEAILADCVVAVTDALLSRLGRGAEGGREEE